MQSTLKSLLYNKTTTTSIVGIIYVVLFSSWKMNQRWVSQHQKGKPFWTLLEQEMMGWQWHQMDHMQITCTSLQTDNHVSTSPVSF